MNIGCLYQFYSSCPKQEQKLHQVRIGDIFISAKIYETFFNLERK